MFSDTVGATPKGLGGAGAKRQRPSPVRLSAAVFTSLLALQMQTASVAATAKENPPTLPQSARNAAGLVKKPWTVVATADGDLNGDCRSDVALIALYEDGQETPPVTPVSRLIVALRDELGVLHVVEESDTATMAHCGPAGGAPSLAIKNRVLIVHQFCGSRTKYEFTHKYQLRKEKWLLIGYEAAKFDSMAPTFKSTIDVNFVTGETAAALLEEGKVKQSERFLEIRAPRIQSTGPGITDWAVPRIVIRPLTKEDPAIATQAVFNTKYLFIRVQYDPPGKTTPFKVTLLDSAGKPITPVDSAVTPYGYILTSYDLASPQVKSSTVTTTTDWSAAEGDTLMHLTLEVQPSQGSPAVFKTSRKSAGAVLLSKSHEPIALDNINVEEDPMPHPFVFKLPTD